MSIRLILASLIFVLPLPLLAQDSLTVAADTAKVVPKEKSWKISGKSSLTLSQTSYSNWAAGGQNSISGVVAGTFRLKHSRKKLSWENVLDLAYGTLYKYEDSDRRKTDDKINFVTKLGYSASKSWHYTVLTEFATQFDKGYKSYPIEDTGNYSSRFMSPAYLTFSIGMDYKPNSDLSVYISPLTLKNTIVLDDTLSSKGSFGVAEGSHIYSEYGALLKAVYTKTFFDRIVLKSQVDLFSNLEHRPQNINVNVEVDVGFKTTSWLTTRLYTQLKYDDNIKVSEDEGPALQVKEVLGIGLSYSF